MVESTKKQIDSVESNPIDRDLSKLKNEVIDPKKIDKNGIKNDLQTLESLIIKQHFEKNNKIGSIDAAKNVLYESKKKLNEIKNTIKSSVNSENNPELEIYRHDPSIKNKLDQIAKIFSPEQSFAIIREISNGKLDIKNPSDYGRIESILTLYSNIPKQKVLKNIFSWLLLPKVSL